MIRRVSDHVGISYSCEMREDEFLYSARIHYGLKALVTEPKPIPQDEAGLRDLCELWAEKQSALKERAGSRSISEELGPFKARGEAAFMGRIRKQKEIDDHNATLLAELQRKVDSARRTVEIRMESVPVVNPFLIFSEGRHFAIRDGTLWSSARTLTSEEWIGLISHELNREKSKLASALAGVGQTQTQRSAIPSDVRTEVWRRDMGRCASCGSRERLEFDHIIPVALGGSNTSRNIELLCETCNRAKSASIS